MAVVVVAKNDDKRIQKKLKKNAVLMGICHLLVEYLEVVYSLAYAFRAWQRAT